MKSVNLMTWVALALLTCAAHARAKTSSAGSEPPEWTTPLAPFHIAGNLYYVGSQDLASYLLVTPRGNVLKAIEQLGFKYVDTKVLLISHAHFDHAAGSAQIIRDTGARYMVMDADVPVAHKTPGHTRGCTTWTLKLRDGARSLDVVIVGSWNVNPGYRLVERASQPDSYPGIAEDYEHSFVVLKSLPCDIFLGAHGQYFHMREKLDRLEAAPGAEVWIDPRGYQEAVAEKEQAFYVELKKQQQMTK